MDLDLRNREWKKFKLGSIFEIENCKCSKVSTLNKGSVSYVGATNKNNGVLKYVELNEKLITKGNCIVFICDGEGSIGYSVYKSEDFIGSTTVKVGRRDELNRYNATFITSIADKVRSKYSFGFKRNETHLKNEMLILPITSDGEPDYAFMEAYMRQKEQKKLKEYEHYITKCLNQLSTNAVLPLTQKQWKEFCMSEVFSIKAGTRLIKAEMRKGDKPFIGATDNNNGITAFISNSNASKDKNVLGVNYNGSVVENFYHPYTAIFSDDVKRISFKNTQGNQFLFLFVKNQILKQKQKFQYGYKFNTTRMSKQKILLPTTPEGTPDYDYMENYMKGLEYQKLTAYCTYKGLPQGCE